MQVSQDQNREKGESRTQAFLADDFWVLKRSVDVAGADFLVQQPCFQLEEVHKRKEEIQSLGIVQAKFFQDNKTSVSIKKDYVVYDGKVVNEFFAMLHTGNGDEKSHYFFTAEEIVNEFRLDKDEEHYVFRITKKSVFRIIKIVLTKK